MNSLFTIALYTLWEALRNRILLISVVLSLIGVAGASFVGDFATIEYEKTETLLLASFYRFCAVFATIILVVSTMVREFTDKCLELYLSYPISRALYFFGKLTGFLLAGVAIAAVYALILLLYAPPAVVLLWYISLCAELTIISAMSFFCVMTFNQQVPASVITAFFFYLLCRISDALVLIGQSELILHTTGAVYLGNLMKGLNFILPTLGRFTQSEWLVYPPPALLDTLPLILGETLIYTALLSVAALFDFLRKNL